MSTILSLRVVPPPPALPSDLEAIATDPSCWADTELFAYRAPFLEEKLVKARMFACGEDVSAYLQEVKKYLALNHLDDGDGYPMFSRVVDEVWHQFVLFTVEYARFSDRFFGYFVHHAPNNAPSPPNALPPQARTYADFVTAYEAVFGPLSPLWDDMARVGLGTRIIRHGKSERSLGLRDHGDRVELVSLLGDDTRGILRVDAWGDSTLRFILEHEVFFVRELPGQLHPDDKVQLALALLKRSEHFQVGT